MARVEILFVGEDKASAPIKTISGEITDLGKEAEKADKKAGGLGSALGGIGKVVAGAGIGLAITAITGLGAALIGGIGDAREANQIMAQTRSVIASTGAAAGVTAEHVADLSGALSAASGKSLFGDSQIQESANLLLTFTNLKGGVLDAATAMSVDLAQAMGGAPADAAVQLGKALNDPINGISALSRVGVSFTDQQKEQIKTMQEAGNMAGAQAIILAELNKEFGGSAEAAARADGGMAMFKDRMGELAESVGAQVLPALNSLMAWLNSPEVMAAINAMVQGLVDGLGAAFTWLSTVALPILLAAFQAVWPAIQAAVVAVYTWLHDVMWPWLQGTAFPWLQNVALPALQHAFEVVWPIIQAAVAAVYQFLSGVVWPWLQNTAFPWLTDTALPALQRAFEIVWPIIQKAVSVVYDFFKNDVWPWLQEAFRHTTEEEIPAIRRAFEVAWPIIQKAVSTVYDFLSGTVWPWIQTAMTNIVTWINEAEAGWSAAWALFSGPVETAKNTISGIIESIKNTVQGAINLINTLIGLINKIPGVSIPTLPGGTTGGGSGYGTKSAGTFTPLGGISGHPGGSVASTVIHIDARGATDPRGVQQGVERAVSRLVGQRADIRLRTS